MKIFKRIILGAILGIAAAVVAQADTTTTRFGLTKPDIGSTNWGPKINTNADLIDTAAGQNIANTFSSSNTFNGQVGITDQLYLDNGSVSAPSLAFTDSIQTGLLLGQANLLSLAVGGNSCFEVGASSVVSKFPFYATDATFTNVTIASATIPAFNATVATITFLNSSVVTPTRLTPTTITGSITDSSTMTHTGGHFFKNGISVSTSAGQVAQFHIGTSSISTNMPTFITAGNATVSPGNSFYGATISSFVATPGYSYATGNNQYYDVIAITVPAGKWLLLGNTIVNANGATITDHQASWGTSAGNSSAGSGRDNSAQSCLATSTYDCATTLPAWVVSPTSQTTYYLKDYLLYSVATPRSSGGAVAIRLQ